MAESEQLLEQAIEAFRRKKFTQAIQKLEQLLTADPTHPDALESLGVCYEKVNRLDDAIDAMKRLASAAPNHVMARANLSRYYAEKGMILEAEQEQAEARRLSWKAELKAQKKSGEAKVHEPSPEEDARERAKDIEDRIARYKKVIALDPDDVLGYFSLGTACLDAKRLEEASRAFRKAIEVDPNHSPSFFNLGVALESLDQKQEAINIYERGVRVADAKGDLIPLKKMQARLSQLGKNV
jgi:tetratricopeptide (TPR) repeat protein